MNAPADEAWSVFGVGLLLSVVISISLQQIRQITYTRLHELAFLNKAKEQHLLQAQSLLEERVNRRTQELALLNFELQDEVMRRHQVEEQLKQEELVLKEERNNLEEEVIKRTAALSNANIQLKQAMNMRDAFVANMSHELRTPLNSILGNAEILQETLYGPLNSRQLRAVNRIESSGRHLLSLISDILDVSKIESGKFQVQLAPVNISALCRSSLSMVKVNANSKQIDLSLVLDPEVKMVILDSRRIKQAIVNLLSNAVKFTPAGGRVGLIVRGQPAKQQVRIIVWDTGVGIAEKHLQKLFEPFIQLDSSLAKEHEGTGLGLSLARQLVELHNGSIGVKSQLGKGSLFVITLPWAPATRINFDTPQTRNDDISAETTPTSNTLPIDAEPSEIIEWVKLSANSLSPPEPLENAG
ncbi:MAG TPA: hypothetical protein ENJ56_06595 [Anaerolineae bacterium]|nr:hypothetical protein [Anaerolineae bacterium]